MLNDHARLPTPLSIARPWGTCYIISTHFSISSYEDTVADPHIIMTQIATFLGVEVRYPDPSPENIKPSSRAATDSFCPANHFLFANPFSLWQFIDSDAIVQAAGKKYLSVTKLMPAVGFFGTRLREPFDPAFCSSTLSSLILPITFSHPGSPD